MTDKVKLLQALRGIQKNSTCPVSLQAVIDKTDRGEYMSPSWNVTSPKAELEFDLGVVYVWEPKVMELIKQVRKGKLDQK